MSRKAILSKVRAHKIVALILIIVAVVASTTVVVYRFALFTAFLGVSCSPNTVRFQPETLPPRTVYQVFSPVRITICFTDQVQGRLPVEGLRLVPNIVLTNPNGFSACGYDGTICGGVNVSASPAFAYSSPETVHVVATIEVPAGSTRGVYLVFFAPGCTGAVLSLRIGLDKTPQVTSSPALECPFPTYGVGVTFNAYSGMIPVYQNGTIPVLL